MKTKLIQTKDYLLLIDEKAELKEENMILEQFLNKKAKEIDNPIRNWGVGYTAEVINEWINLQIQAKKLAIPAVSKSFTAKEVVNELEDCDTLDDAIMFFKEQM